MPNRTTLTTTCFAAMSFSVCTLATAGEPLSALPPRTIPPVESTLPRASDTASRSLMTTRLVGIAKPSRYAELHAAVSTPILEITVQTGDRVNAGDVLVRQDDRIARTAVKIAEVEAARKGALASAVSQQQLAEQKFQRALTAFERNAASQFEVDEKRSARDQAAAHVTIERESLARAQANLERTQAELDEFSILAPFDGEVVEVHQQAGSTVDRSKPVVTIADRRKLHVELHLPLTEFGAVKPGSLLSLQADEPVKSSLQGRVTVVSSYVNSASRTFRVQLEIENGNEQLPAGFTVRHSGTR